MKCTAHSAQRIAQLIVALDVDNLKEARRLVNLLYPAVKIFKIGIQLFTATGPGVIEMINRKGAQVFLDLKFYDIPNTVANAVRQAAALRVFMLDVHIQGGEGMLRAAALAARSQARKLKIKPPLVLGITVLTSQRGDNKIKQLVLSHARLAKRCALDGVVASVWEAPLLRKNLGEDFFIVTPGIRLKAGAYSDQKRVASPRQAILSGSDYLVVGRPIIGAKDPLRVAKHIVEEIRSGVENRE
jgi:orotidine-5'-phosphate decarboxylase